MKRRSICHSLISLVTSFLVGLSANAGEKEPKNVTPPDREAVLTEAVGTLIGFTLYQSYLNIGLIADSASNDLLSLRDADEALSSVLIPLEKVEAQLQKISKIIVNKEDASRIEKSREIVKLLKKQGASLQKFWSSSATADGEAYEKTRVEVWKKIDSLLGLSADQKPEIAPAPREKKSKD